MRMPIKDSVTAFMVLAVPSHRLPVLRPTGANLLVSLLRLARFFVTYIEPGVSTNHLYRSSLKCEHDLRYISCLEMLYGNQVQSGLSKNIYSITTGYQKTAVSLFTPHKLFNNSSRLSFLFSG